MTQAGHDGRTVAAQMRSTAYASAGAWLFFGISAASRDSDDAVFLNQVATPNATCSGALVPGSATNASHLVVAPARPIGIGSRWGGLGMAVIDVRINRLADTRVGVDVDFEEARKESQYSRFPEVDQ